jgi:uncharacterized protein
MTEDRVRSAGDEHQTPLRSRISHFLAAHTTLTLATTGPTGAPAAAAVFYAHDNHLDLYFLSEDSTLHGQNMLANRRVAGAIQEDGQNWRSLRGLQIRGEVYLVPATEQAQATAVYIRKFAFVGAQLVGTKGPGVLTGPLARARFWRLRPSWLRLVDNTVSFGFKEELLLNECDRPT